MPNSPKKSALIRREPDSLIASDEGLAVSASEYCQQIHALMDQLPVHQYAINICKERFNFQRSMAAVISAGQCNLLPPNRQQATLRSLAEQFPDSYILHDSEQKDLPEHIHLLDFSQLDKTLSVSSPQTTDSPIIDDEQLAAISFTSGSTGQSKPNRKTWAMLRQGNAINIENMLEDSPPGLHMLATVPPQHMYGLELSVMLSMSADVCVHSGQPLFPYDVQQALLRMPEPRCLVSTPQHLKALLGSGLEFPAVERVFSATAPMDKHLANAVEQCFKTRVIEIYGCSEVGSIARRYTAQDDNWTLFSAMTMVCADGLASIKAPHLEDEYELQDSIKVQSDGTFSLHGRLSDLINIAGKRGSLSQINQHLLAIPQVEDGIVFDPETGHHSNKRLAALVVATDVEKSALLDTLRENLDPVFLPRPIVFTDSLPRNETGKLQRQAVLNLFYSLRQQH
ncbi:MAG: AMP-binding protein [Granulosicoccus sp.]